MRTIYKYPLHVADSQIVEMPQGAEILSAQVQHGQICLWAKVNTDAPPRPRVIGIFGTGHEMPQLGTTFISTVQMLSGDLMFHVFEMK